MTDTSQLAPPVPRLAAPPRRPTPARRSSKGLRQRAGLYVQTARHLRPGQIAARLELYAKRRTLHRCAPYLVWRYGVADSAVRLASAPLVPFDAGLVARELVAAEAGAQVAEQVAALAANRFTFLNRTVAFGERIRWDAPGEGRLWRYNLHYFDFVQDLVYTAALRDDDTAYREFRRLAADWIAHNPVAHGAGWHAYPVALRVVNWMYATVAFANELAGDAPFRAALLRSLYGQCRYLADHLEWDSRGNHLLEDGKSLLTAGLFFAGAEATAWLRQGARIVWRSLRDEVAQDGGHFERSPMYHGIVLQDYLEILALYRARGLRLPRGADDRVRAMLDFYLRLRHPDGEIPLFGDSAFGIARGPNALLPLAAVLLREPRYRRAGATLGPYAAVLLGAAGARAWAALPIEADADGGGLAAFPQSGYFVLGDGHGQALLLDAGEIGPPEVPAHGHSNLFGYELSVGGQRVIVDSGVETYEPGPWRAYYRSTRAHNTLLVDGVEPSETWSAFRVARRARVYDVRWQFGAELSWAGGTHDGFARALTGLQHRRVVGYLPDVGWLVLDHLWGAELTHQVTSFVHLHPEVRAEFGFDATARIRLRSHAGEALLHLVPFGFSSVRQIAADASMSPQGWYAPEFGRRMANNVLELSADSRLPHVCGYALVLAHPGLLALDVAQRGPDVTCTMSTGDATYELLYATTRGTLALAATVARTQ